jgi:hypothetical protein
MRKPLTLLVTTSLFLGCVESGSPESDDSLDQSTGALEQGNLFVNPSFETNTASWNSWQGSISRVALSGAPDGSYVAKVSRGSGDAFSIDDDKPTVASVPAGATYSASVYVRAASASSVGKSGVFALREWKNGAEVKRWRSPTVTLSNTWQKVVVSGATPAAGNSLDAFFVQSSATSGDAFYADAFDLRSCGAGNCTADAGPPSQDAGTSPSQDAGTSVPPTGGGSGQALFVGDYSTGDFSQWLTVQTKSYNDRASGWPGTTYPAMIVTDPAKGKVARYEVHQGDVVASGERSEVRGSEKVTGGGEGDVRWFSFSTKFDSSFYTTWGKGEWGATNQWHAEDFIDGNHSPPIAFGYSGWGGHVGSWELNIKSTGTGAAIWSTPLDVGAWHDIKMEITWSTNPTKGHIRLWHNGVPQTFAGGGTTWTGQTMATGSASNYYKEGLYRSSRAEPGVVFHTGFKSATTEAGLL